MRLMNINGKPVNSGFRAAVLAIILPVGACHHLPQQLAGDNAPKPVPGVQPVSTPVKPLDSPVAAATGNASAKPSASEKIPITPIFGTVAIVQEQEMARAPAVSPPASSAPSVQPPVQESNMIKSVVTEKPLEKPLEKPVAQQIAVKPATVQTPAIPSRPELKNKPELKKMEAQKNAPQTTPQSTSQSSPQTAPQAETKPALPGTVQGSIVILGKNSEKLEPKDVIVNLEPLFDSPQPAVPPRTFSIDMKGKRYLPGALAIHTGDKVNFHNRDTIKHNVFSSSAENTFDLGTYGLNVTQGVSLKHPGIVKVYCNIHAEMATFISINDKGYTTITKADGKFSFKDVPPGEYLLKIWHVRGETRKRFSVAAGKVVQNNITLDTTAFELEPHLNKFGKSYQVNPTLFKDEFY